MLHKSSKPFVVGRNNCREKVEFRILIKFKTRKPPLEQQKWRLSTCTQFDAYGNWDDAYDTGYDDGE